MQNKLHNEFVCQPHMDNYIEISLELGMLLLLLLLIELDALTVDKEEFDCIMLIALSLLVLS